MAQANRNWRIFRAHEIAIRTAVNQPLAQAELDAERGWSRIVDKSAYVDCLKDITVARQVYDSSYQQVRGLYSNGLVLPWTNVQITILNRALSSLKDLLRVIRRLRTEQRRTRAIDWQNASGISIHWTMDQDQRAVARIDSLKKAIRLVSRPAPQSEEPSSSSSSSSSSSEEEEGEGEGEGDQDPNAAEVENGVRQAEQPGNLGGNAPQQLSNEVSGPVRKGHGRKPKRPGEELVDEQPSLKSPWHSNDELALSNEDDDVDSEDAELQAQLDFVTKWLAFLEEREGKDGKRWEDMHEVADKVFQLCGQPEYPNETGDEEEFRVRINKILESAIWQSRIDKVSENGNGVHQGAKWKQTLQLAREAAMRKALGGEACSPPPASPLPYTAAIAAEKFGFGGAESGIQGQWTYLLSLGRGGQGEAGL